MVCCANATNKAWRARSCQLDGNQFLSVSSEQGQQSPKLFSQWQSLSAYAGLDFCEPGSDSSEASYPPSRRRHSPQCPVQLGGYARNRSFTTPDQPWTDQGKS